MDSDKKECERCGKCHDDDDEFDIVVRQATLIGNLNNFMNDFGGFVKMIMEMPERHKEFGISESDINVVKKVAAAYLNIIITALQDSSRKLHQKHMEGKNEHAANDTRCH